MGKNSNKNRKGKKPTFKTSGTPAEILHSVMPAAVRAKDLDDDEGFILTPTAYGRDQMNAVHMRRSKKSSGELPINSIPTPYSDFNPNAAIQMLDDALGKVRDGKFKKAMEKRNKGTIDDLADAFLNMDKDLPNFQRVSSAIGKLLQVGKSFYEYDDNHRVYMDDSIYDRVLAKYRAYGFDEPTGIVPNSKSKVGITYPTLHNNMDKSYALRSGDSVPDGVKEDTRVEDWLLKSFKTLGISTETEVELELSPKIDGVSINGTIKGEGFYDPQTRGDENESVPVPGLNALAVGDKDVECSVPEFGIQYELFVTDKDRVAAGEYLKLTKPYVSNRHAASGILNRLATKPDDELLSFISLYPIEAVGMEEIYSERMDVLQQYAIVPDDMIDRETIKGNVKDLLKQIEKKFAKLGKKRENLSYSIDGMVITFVDPDYQNTLGRSKRTNNYQLALKFDPANAKAEVSDIHLDSGKKGFRTVQVDLKHPVFLDGVRYDHVPVLSARLYEDLGLREGTVVNVHRVGDVIPSITVIENGNGRKLSLPEKCPDCGGKLVIKNKKLYCGYGNCKGNLSGKITGFLSGIGLDGYGDSFADSLVKTYKLTSLHQLFDITEEALEKVGLTGKVYRQFAAALRNAVADTPDFKVLGSIGIPDVGPARAKLLLMEYGGWGNFSKEWAHADDPGATNRIIGSKIWESIGRDARANLSSSDTIKMIRVLRDYVKTITAKFDNLRLGHTGMEPTAKIKEVCKAKNIDIVDGRAFDMLLTSSMDSESDKMQAARKKDIPIYTEEMFLAQYGE